MLLLILTLSSIAFGSECSFENDVKTYQVSLAKQDAAKSYAQIGVNFIAVANGLAPSRPGFENIRLSKCLLLDTQWKIFWVGADTEVCEDHDGLTAHASHYALNFNKQMLKLAQLSNEYQCVIKDKSGSE